MKLCKAEGEQQVIVMRSFEQIHQIRTQIIFLQSLPLEEKLSITNGSCPLSKDWNEEYIVFLILLPLCLLSQRRP
jgi:hypothetical protein